MTARRGFFCPARDISSAAPIHMTGVIDMLHYTIFPQDQKTLERLLSQLIAARLLAPPRKEDRR